MAISNAVKRQDVQHDAAYLRYLPEHLRERYQESLHDAQLTHLRRQIALMDVRVKLLLEALDQKTLTTERIAQDIQEEFPALDAAVVGKVAEYVHTFLPEGHIDTRTYRGMQRLVNKYKGAMAEKRLIVAAEALTQLFHAIEIGQRDDAAWQEIQQVMDNRRKLVEAEERRLFQSQQSLSIDRVVAMVSLAIQSLREAVVRYVPDTEIQQYILLDAERAYASHLSGETNPAADPERLDG